VLSRAANCTSAGSIQIREHGLCCALDSCDQRSLELGNKRWRGDKARGAGTQVRSKFHFYKWKANGEMFFFLLSCTWGNEALCFSRQVYLGLPSLEDQALSLKFVAWSYIFLSSLLVLV
jgi:hypothetical protein